MNTLERLNEKDLKESQKKRTKKTSLKNNKALDTNTLLMLAGKNPKQADKPGENASTTEEVNSNKSPARSSSQKLEQQKSLVPSSPQKEED